MEIVHEIKNQKVMKTSKREVKMNFHVIFATRNLQVGPSLKTYMEIVHEMRNQKVMKTSKREVKTNFHVIFATRNLQWDLH